MGYFSSIYSAELPHRAVTVYMYLRDRTDSDGKCYPSIRTISRELSLSRSTVKRALKDLEAHGFMSRSERYRENGSSSSNLYTLITVEVNDRL